MSRNVRKKITVADIVSFMERLAPPCLAESWDNSGLQIGDRKWPVAKIWVALDPLLAVIEAAAQQQVDMVVTHHPLIFKPIRNIHLDTAQGRTISGALKAEIAIYAAHTNLDIASDGVNDILAQKIGLSDITAMIPVQSDIGKSAEKDKPSITGMGRIGLLARPVTLAHLAQQIKKQFGLEIVKISGRMDKIIQTVAVCSGSGGGLLTDYLATKADVYISGDLHYHDARTIEDAGRGLIDIGHFNSEHIIVDALCERLQEAATEFKWDVSIAPCRIEEDPFTYI